MSLMEKLLLFYVITNFLFVLYISWIHIEARAMAIRRECRDVNDSVQFSVELAKLTMKGEVHDVALKDLYDKIKEIKEPLA